MSPVGDWGRGERAYPPAGGRLLVEEKAKGFLVFASALALRIASILLLGRGVTIAPGTDAVSYDQFARLMLSGPGWVKVPLAVREPLYPAFMALAYALPGGEIPWLQFLQALLGAGVCWLVYRWLRSSLGEGVALAAALLVAANPHFLFYTPRPLRENLVMPLVTASILAVYRAWRSRRERDTFLAALLYALLVHTDVRFLPLVLPLLVAASLMERSASAAARRSLVFGLWFLVLMVPYQVRSSLALGKPVVVTERFLGQWLPLVSERYHAREGREEWLASWEQAKRDSLGLLTPSERGYFLSGGRPATTRGGIYIYNFVDYWRFLRLRPSYRPYPDGRFEPPWSLRHQLASTAALAPFFLFLPLAWRRREARGLVGLLLLFLAAHAAMHVVVHARERYRVPVESLMDIVAGVGLVGVWTWIQAKRRMAK